MINLLRVLCVSGVLLPLYMHAAPMDAELSVSVRVIQEQRATLALNTQGKGYGPQSPRDIDTIKGNNPRIFAEATPYSKMNLCNIHFHKNEEHRGGEFTQYAGHGDGHGNGSGYQYSGQLSAAELTPLPHTLGDSKHGSLHPGDTIEVHYVHSSAQVSPGPTLGACLSEENSNPQLRVETQVYVLVHDAEGRDFTELTQLGVINGLHQALNIPANTGKPVQYAGSTTGPGYNEKASPLQVSWSVRPLVMKLDINTVASWLKGNVFNEDHAHGVRNLVVNPDLLSDNTEE